MTASIESGFIVFIIGLRINKFMENKLMVTGFFIYAKDAES